MTANISKLLDIPDLDNVTMGAAYKHRQSMSDFAEREARHQGGRLSWGRKLEGKRTFLMSLDEYNLAYKNAEVAA